jgi:hypothetical protein
MHWSDVRDVLPVLALALGYAGTFLTERLRDRSEVRRARAAAVLDFEREVLLETQTALYQYAGEIQDFALALRGESDRSYSSIVGTAWRASAQLEMLATRLAGDDLRDDIGEVLAAGQAIMSGSWPDDDWSESESVLLEKLVDQLLEHEARASGSLGDRLRTITFA